jgi:hypothetical protein
VWMNSRVCGVSWGKERDGEEAYLARDGAGDGVAYAEVGELRGPTDSDQRVTVQPPRRSPDPKRARPSGPAPFPTFPSAVR